MNRRRLLAALGSSGVLAGCATRFAPGGGAGTPARDVDSPPPPPADAPVGYTHLRPDGNRRFASRARLPETDPVDVALGGAVEWVVGVPHDDGVLLGVVTAAGTRAVSVGGDGVTAVDVDLGTATGPPLLVGGDEPRFSPTLGSTTTHPVPMPEGWASVTAGGVVRLPGGENVDVGAVPDARLVAAAGRLYVLADRTTAYAHGVLGDEIEAGAVAVVDPSGGVEATLEPPSGVIEAIAPIVADVDGDGDREVLVTASDAERGARLVALSADDATQSAEGPAVGAGFRWRHQLAVAPFGPGGETEVAAVKTPHIGGTAEFYRATGGRLELVASRRGYSTHTIGSRNLDTAVATDLDGDGRVELLVPDDPQRALAGLRRTGESVAEAWRVSLDGRLTSNVCAVDGPAGVVVAAGVGRRLRVWPA
jgi:hypothetical protein